MILRRPLKVLKKVTITITEVEGKTRKGSITLTVLESNMVEVSKVIEQAIESQSKKK